MTDTLDVIVVGGGQAGLAAAYHLREAGRRFLVLEANPRVGDSWRRRWDSLVLFTVARYSALPGLPFPGDPERFPGKDEVADYLETYARTFELPVVPDTRVEHLESVGGRYIVHTARGSYEARDVVVASGAYQLPHRPRLADALGDGVQQVHSAEYRNPEQLAEGNTLVVGSANSGVQIAEELIASRPVKLARGRPLTALPRRILGRSLHWWAEQLRLIDAPLHTIRGRLMNRDDLLVGTSVRRLGRLGVELHGRVVAAEDRRVRFEDGAATQVDVVVWATGYRSDYSWIDAPILDERGEPRHTRGVTPVPGLYFVGLQKQHSRGSSLIGWVTQDASFIVEQIVARSGGGR